MVRRKLGSGLAVLVLLSLSFVVLTGNAAYAAPPAPGATYSLYVTNATRTQLCNWGERIASDQLAGTIDADAFIIMHFFAPWRDSATGNYGASRSGNFQTNAQIRSVTQRLGECWFLGTGAARTLKIAMGVTSDNSYGQVTSAHGSAWANMVANANNWAATNGYNSRLSFNGAFDPEPGFGATVSQAKNWMDGYRNANTGWNVFFYGAANGCPSDKSPTSVCTWPRDDIIYLAWQTGVTTAFPQIYDEEPPSANPPTSVNAQQWQKLSERAVNLGKGRINFAGGLSQYQACIDQNHPQECTGTENTPQASWKDLWNEVNCTFDSGTCTTNDDLRWATQLTWHQGPF
jgi:hypothetical protein